MAPLGEHQGGPSRRQVLQLPTAVVGHPQKVRRSSQREPCVLRIGRRLEHGGTAGFQRRIVDDELDEVFPEIAAISLDGPKAVGKTTAAGQRARAVVRLDEWERQTLVRASPSMILDHPRPGRRRIDHRLVHADPRCCDSWADGQTLSRGCGRVPRRAHRAVAPGPVADVGPGRQHPQPPRCPAETPLGGPGAVGPPARAGLPGALLTGAGRVMNPGAGVALGALFEALATLSVRVFAQTDEAGVRANDPRADKRERRQADDPARG